MKYIQYTICWILLLLIISCNNRQPIPAVSAIDSTLFKNIFSGDSGLLNNKTIVPFLLAQQTIDTSGRSSFYSPDTSTSGKYYRLQKNGHYLACVGVVGETFEHLLLFEATADGKIVNAFPYTHGNYACCSGPAFNNFGKTGDYFYIRTCGTGSAFCASYLCFFKELKPQDALQSIWEWYWQGGYTDGHFEELSSTMSIKADTIFMNYQIGNGLRNKHAKVTDRFKVKYVITNGQLAAADSTALNKYAL